MQTARLLVLFAGVTWPDLLRIARAQEGAPEIRHLGCFRDADMGKHRDAHAHVEKGVGGSYGEGERRRCVCVCVCVCVCEREREREREYIHMPWLVYAQ